MVASCKNKKNKKIDNEPAGDVTHQQQYGGTVAVT